MLLTLDIAAIQFLMTSILSTPAAYIGQQIISVTESFSRAPTASLSPSPSSQLMADQEQPP
jgi:hypothetical protein